ncbi:MAG: hypothetical protein ACRDJ9_13455 [Dehalococcoidia bacterium]
MAFVIWCWDDPVVRINGETVSIEVGIQGSPEVVRDSVRGVETIITLPEGVSGETVSVTDDYFLETVRYLTVPAAEQVGIEVCVDAARVLPVALRVNGWVMAEGTTATPLTTEIHAPQYA